MIYNALYRYAFLAAGMLCFVLPGGAQHYTYAPNSISFCQLQKKYDSSLGGGIGRTLNSRSIELQAAFSPIKRGAVMVNYFDARRKGVTKQQETGSSSQFAEIGIGAYEATAHGTASIFVGFGQGSVFNNYSFNRIASHRLTFAAGSFSPPSCTSAISSNAALPYGSTIHFS